MRRKLSLVGAASFLPYSAIAHANDTHMMDGMHAMQGHWYGGLFMITLWVLAILAIIYLGQQIIDNNRGDAS